MNKIQYTIRNIPVPVDQVIRKRAAQSGKSFNSTVLEMLTLQTFGTLKPKTDDNFEWLFNKNTLDGSFDEAQKGISQIDKSLWQ